MKDFLGNKYGPRDIIVYVSHSGRSANLVKAEVVSISDKGNVVVQPLEGARFKRYGETKWVNVITGKTINPYATGEHTEVESHFIYNPTGERVEYHDRWAHADRMRTDGLPLAQGAYTYIPSVWKEYVQEVEEPPRKVTLTITENIILVEKRP